MIEFRDIAMQRLTTPMMSSFDWLALIDATSIRFPNCTFGQSHRAIEFPQAEMVLLSPPSMEQI